MNTSDVQVYDYVTDGGRRISVSLATFGERNKDRMADVSITVDGVERLHTPTHFKVPATVPMGEWLVFVVTQCLSRHMVAYTTFQLLHNLLSMAFEPDELQILPPDDRHITELTDEQAEWWNEEDNHEIVGHLIEATQEIAERAIEEYPSLVQEKN